MASCTSSDSEDSIRVYTTDTIVDNPGAEIVYKGLITCASNTLYHTKRNPEIVAKMTEAMEKGKNKKLPSDVLAYLDEVHRERDRKLNVNSDILDKLTEEAKEKAKKLQANAIVGVRIAETYNSKSNRLEVAFIGTAVHFTPRYTPAVSKI